MRLVVALSILALSTGAALAQEDLVIDQSKVYVTEPAACQALAKQGADAFIDLDFLSLTFDRGIQTIEYNCNFYDIKTRPNTPVLFVDAVCEIPGDLYPDILAIAPNGEDSILVVSSSDTILALANSDAPPSDYPAGTTIYHRCDNLSEIPF